MAWHSSPPACTAICWSAEPTRFTIEPRFAWSIVLYCISVWVLTSNASIFALGLLICVYLPGLEVVLR